mmetsp:Transcript_18097/g.39384  ORF Transcript_18097/g.39384 Transcript_18097/m.39384 type:complete len:207 (-) Transcript_18097:85-705(-)
MKTRSQLSCHFRKFFVRMGRTSIQVYHSIIITSYSSSFFSILILKIIIKHDSGSIMHMPPWYIQYIPGAQCKFLKVTYRFHFSFGWFAFLIFVREVYGGFSCDGPSFATGELYYNYIHPIPMSLKPLPHIPMRFATTTTTTPATTPIVILQQNLRSQIQINSHIPNLKLLLHPPSHLRNTPPSFLHFINHQTKPPIIKSMMYLFDG